MSPSSLEVAHRGGAAAPFHGKHVRGGLGRLGAVDLGGLGGRRVTHGYSSSVGGSAVRRGESGQAAVRMFHGKRARVGPVHARSGQVWGSGSVPSSPDGGGVAAGGWAGPAWPPLRLLRGWFFGCCRGAGGAMTGLDLLRVDPVVLAPSLGRLALLPRGVRGSVGLRVVADDVELLTHRPQVGGQPVDEHTDREVDAGHHEEEREDVEQDLLLLHHRVVLRGVLDDQLALRRERRDRHEDDEDRGEDVRGGRGSVWCRAWVNVAQIGTPKIVEWYAESTCAWVMTPYGMRLGDAVVEHAEQREEDRRLGQDRQAARERVGARVLVERHHLGALALAVAGVLLLDLLDLRLEDLQVALALDLPHEQRDQGDADDDDEADDRRAPTPSPSRSRGWRRTARATGRGSRRRCPRARPGG